MKKRVLAMSIWVSRVRDRCKKWLMQNWDLTVSFLCLALVLFALVYGFWARFSTLGSYTHFLYDEARDAYVYLDMKDGNMPAYGPVAFYKEHEYFLPPHYYYLVGPFSLLGVDPIWQVLPTTILTFLSVPLFGWLVYLMFEGISRNRRKFVASLAMVFASVFLYDITFSNMEWNPTTVMFFLILYGVLFWYIFRYQEDLKWQVVLWATVGAVVLFVSSMHSIVLFSLPFAFGVGCLQFVYENKHRPKYIGLPLVALVTILVLMLPYWVGEVRYDWLNTSSMFGMVLDIGDQESSVGLGTKLGRVGINFLRLVEKGYFISPDLGYLAVFFVFLTGLYGVWSFGGHKKLWIQYFFMVLFYSYAVSNYASEPQFRYQIVIWYVPIVLALSIVAYAKLQNWEGRGLFFVTVMLIGLSSVSNIYYFRHGTLERKLGVERLLNKNDLVNIMSNLPEQSRVCYASENFGHPMRYLDETITMREHRIYPGCKFGGFYIRPKQDFGPNHYSSRDFKDTFVDMAHTRVVYEDEVYAIYQIME